MGHAVWGQRLEGPQGATPGGASLTAARAGQLSPRPLADPATSPTHPSPHPGVVLAYSNSLAGRLADISTQRHGKRRLLLWRRPACVLAIAALLLFSTFGSLGREDLVPSKPKRA